MPTYPTYKLGDVADYINGRAFKPKEWKEKGLPIVRIQNLNDENAEYHYSDVMHEDKYLLHNGDLLFAWAASLGTYIWNNGDAWLNQHIFKVIPKENVSKKYLYYALTSIIKELYAKSHGSGMVHVTKDKFVNTEIPLPPLPTQHQIVSRIESLFAELDKAVEHLRTAQQQLKIYKQVVLKSAFESCINAQKHLFGELMADVRNGYGAKPSDCGDYKLLRISSVRAMNLNLNDFRFNNSSFDEKDIIQENDLLFTRYNGSVDLVGVCAVVPKLNDTYAYPDKVIRCRPKTNDTFHSKFLQYYINQGKARVFVRSKIKTTSGQNGISGSDIKKIEIPIPPLPEQQRIVKEIESRLSQAEAAEARIAEALQKTEALRQSILKKAFSGEFDL